MSKNQILTELSKPLNIKDVDFRIQSISKKGFATILSYKDARVDMNRLDSVCGADWQKDYKTIEGSLFCGIGIKIEKEWLWRWDVGSESFSDKEKGKASDAFKRAGFCWGIGRELYDYPTIQLMLKDDEFKIENNKVKQTYNLKLKNWNWEIDFEENKVAKLTAKDENGLLRFDSTKDFNGVPNSNTQPPTPTTKVKPKNEVSSKKTNPPSDSEKNWLNKMDNDKNFTSDWLKVAKGIRLGKLKDLNDVRKWYKVSNDTAKQLEEIFNLTPQSA